MNINYIRAHLSYLLNKRNIIILIYINIIFIFITCIISNTFVNYYVKDLNRIKYYYLYSQSFSLAYKFFYVSLICFISGEYFNNEYDQFKCYFIKDITNIKTFKISRIISILIFSFSEMILLLFIYFIFLIINPYSMMITYMFKGFINSYFLTLFYIILISVLSRFIKSNFLNYIILILYFISNILCNYYDSVTMGKILYFCFPVLVDIRMDFRYGTFIFIVELIILIIIDNILETLKIE